MKTIKQKLLFIITSVMCLFIMFGCLSIKSNAAEQKGTLLEGYMFNRTVKSLTMQNPTVSTEEKLIKKIVFTSKMPATYTSLKSVGEGVTAYYDDKTALVTIYCPTRIIFNKNSSLMFCAFAKVQNIIFETTIDTTNVTNFSTLFQECWSLKELDLSQFKTSNVKRMDSMFDRCDSLKSLDLHGFDTRNVSAMSDMFRQCYYLEELDISSFDTSNVEDMSRMFMECESLKTLDVSKFNTSKVRYFDWMFIGCGVTKLDLSSFDTSNAEYMDNMLACRNVETLDLSSFNTKKVKSMRQLFFRCEKLKSVNVSSFDTSNVSDFRDMFLGCNALKTLDISSFTIKKGSKCSDMLLGRDKNMLEEIISPKETEEPIRIGDERKDFFVLDNDYDGEPDDSEVITGLPVASKSCRYIRKPVKKEKKNESGNNNSSEKENNNNNEDKDSTAKKDSPQSSDESHTADSGSVKNDNKLPTTVVAYGITYQINADGTATVIKIGNIKKATINTITVNGITYLVTQIAANACKGNKYITSLSIGSNVHKIDSKAFYSCKKLKKVKITANKSLVVGKSAFKKVNKEATITVKGVKGKAKKTLIKNIKKQTNAKVK